MGRIAPGASRAKPCARCGRRWDSSRRKKTTDMEKIIKAAVERGASDLHIKAGDVFRARINGKLVPLTKQRLTPDQTRAIALKLLPNEDDRARLDHLKDFD